MSCFVPTKMLPAALIGACVFVFERGPVAASDGVVEILHMWRTASEQKALKVYRNKLEDGGHEWYDEAVKGNVVALQYELSNRIAHGVPPNIVQWVVGDSLQKLVDEGVFKPIKIQNDRLVKELEPDVLPLITYNDKVAAVPVGIHVQNYVVYNQAVLDKYNLEPPKTWDQLISYGPILQRDNIDLIVWGEQQWQVRQLLMAILCSVLTPDQFDRLQHSNQDIFDLREELVRSYQIYLELLKYNSLRGQSGQWEEFAHKVMDGKAAGQILGDFLVPEMEPSGAIWCGLPPESEYILWGLNSFAFLDVDSYALLQGQKAFAEAAFDIPTNIKFVQAKGGVPVLQGIDPALLTRCHSQSLMRWNSDFPRVFSGGDNWRKRLGLIAEYTSGIDFPPTETADEIAGKLMAMLVNF